MVAVNNELMHSAKTRRRRTQRLVDNLYQGLTMRAVRGMGNNLPSRKQVAAREVPTFAGRTNELDNPWIGSLPQSLQPHPAGGG